VYENIERGKWLMKHKLVKGLVLGIIVLLILVSLPAVSENDIENPKENSEIIDYFWFGIIYGVYKTKSSNDDYQLILDTGSFNKEYINIRGLARICLGDRYMIYFTHTSAHVIKAVRFIGYCNHRLVFGFGFKQIDFYGSES